MPLYSEPEDSAPSRPKQGETAPVAVPPPAPWKTLGEAIAAFRAQIVEASRQQEAAE